MILYHGSNMKVTDPDLSHSKPFKDLGRGFYLSADDGVNYQLRRYRGGVISMSRLIEELKYAKGITFQYFFGSERAIKKLIPLL